MSDIKIKFDCNGFNAPAYSCSEPGDNSGYYVQSTDYDKLTQQVTELRGLLKEVQAIIESSPAVTDTIWYDEQNTLYDEIYLRLNGDDKCEQLSLIDKALAETDKE